MRRTNVALKMEVWKHNGKPGLKPVPKPKERPAPALSDIAVLDRRSSKSGLYMRKGSEVVPLKRLGDSKEVLIRVKDDLSQECERYIEERGSLRVREISVPVINKIERAVTSSKLGHEDLLSTTVVRYMVVSQTQAEQLLATTHVEVIPEPKKSTSGNVSNKIMAPVVGIGFLTYAMDYGGF